MSKSQPPTHQAYDLQELSAKKTLNLSGIKYRNLASWVPNEGPLWLGLTSAQKELTSLGSFISSNDPACLSPTLLERLIRDQIPSAPPVVFNLEVEIFEFGSGLRSELAEGQPAFSFFVPLPTVNSPILYSMASDSPCMRGGKLDYSKRPTEQNVGRRGWDRTANKFSKVWSPLLPFQDRKLQNFNVEIELKWNKRIKSSLSPPWLSPLSEDAKSHVEESDLNEATSTLQDSLRSFIEDQNKCRSRWLIGTQNVFGWDHNIIIKGLQGLLEEVIQEGADFYIRLDVRPLASTPFFALHYSGPPHPTYTIPTTISDKLIPFSVCSYMMFAYFAIATGGIKFFVISAILIAAWIVIVILQDVSSTHDSIGLAWPIKKWTKLDLPNHLGEKEVLEALRDQDGSSGKSPRLRLKEKDGWQKLEGFDEMEWIETHRERLKDAMRGRRSGDLTMEWPAYEY